MSYDPSQTPRQTLGLPEFQLESGVLVADFTVAYIVHGAAPAKDGSNVILVTTSLGGDAHRLDFLIGETLALAPEKYCIICVDSIGNGHSASPSNHAELPREHFPAYTMLDMVNSQKRLLDERFGLGKIRAIAGASMGGMQALQWAVSYPNFMDAIIALVPMVKTPPWTRLVHETARRTIMADPAWAGGQYTSPDFGGWRAALALTQALVARSPQYTAAEIGDADPIAWLDGLIANAVANGMDPNDWISQSRAYDSFGLELSALASIKTPVLVLGSETDLLNPVADQRAAAEAIPHASFKRIPSERGHMAANFGDAGDIAFMNDEISAFLASCPAPQT